MTNQITKQDIRRYIKIMKETENKTMFFYEEIAQDVEDENVKSTFEKLAKEEEKHTELVKELMSIVG